MESRTIPPPQASARQTEMGDTFNRVLFSTLDALEENQTPYCLIGGIAVSGMGRPRSTHDIDVFIRPEDAEAALEALARKGFEVERTDPGWLFKGWKDNMMVDLIFKSHGDIYFDKEMQDHAKPTSYHGRDILTVSPEDLIIIKAAVHSEVGPHHWHDALALLSHAQIDWQYLLKRARRAPRRLLALMIYAQSNDILIPNQPIAELYMTVFGSAPGKNPPVTGPSKTAAPAKTTETIHAKSPHPYLLGHIQERLAADMRTGAADVQMVLGGKRLVVRGETSTHDHREAIINVIRENAGDLEIDNQIRVTEMAAPEVETMQ